MGKILVLNGPNLNLLGTREPDQYGNQTLPEIELKLSLYADELGHTATFFQSHSEAELISRIHETIKDQTQFIIFNPAAFTHTSIAIRDALLAVSLPFIEVHLSNIYQRESFRQKSYFSDIAEGVILGLGPLGYELALTAAAHQLNSAQSNEIGPE